MTVRSPAGEDPAVAGIGGHNDVCALLMNEVFLHFRREGEGVLFQGPQGQKKAAVSQGAESFAGDMVGILAGKSRPGGGNGAEPGERRRPPPARLTLAAVYWIGRVGRLCSHCRRGQFPGSVYGTAGMIVRVDGGVNVESNTIYYDMLCRIVAFLPQKKANRTKATAFLRA